MSQNTHTQPPITPSKTSSAITMQTPEKKVPAEHLAMLELIEKQATMLAEQKHNLTELQEICNELREDVDAREKEVEEFSEFLRHAYAKIAELKQELDFVSWKATVISGRPVTTSNGPVGLASAKHFLTSPQHKAMAIIIETVPGINISLIDVFLFIIIYAYHLKSKRQLTIVKSLTEENCTHKLALEAKARQLQEALDIIYAGRGFRRGRRAQGNGYVPQPHRFHNRFEREE
ncbi:hypothetical protein DFH27DRAFT_609727 [Peziza echinospora]|nr:hypothetical protein DFH27DRAFT_609727 [Peziza echinospora]